MSKKTIILVAHGSLHRQANDEVHQLAVALTERTSQQEYLVAFLDAVAKPNIPETIDQAVQEGASEVVVFPYFLNSGNHVQKDIPAIVAEKQSQYPDVTIEITKHFGSHPGMIELLTKILQDHNTP